MGREVYFIKFDKKDVQENLAKTLQEESKYSYQDYIKEGYYKDKVSFEEVFQKSKNDIEQITLEELWSLFAWFNWKVDTEYENAGYAKQEHEFHKETRRNGLNIFYEIPSKTPAWHFFSILGNYQSLRNTDFYDSFSADYFHDFLDYAVCYIGFISQLLIEKYYGKEEGFYFEQFWVIEGKHYQIMENNPSQFEWATNEFDERKERYTNAIDKIVKFRDTPKKSMTTSIYNEYSEQRFLEEEIFGFHHQLDTMLSLKEKIEGYTGCIKILDSY